MYQYYRNLKTYPLSLPCRPVGGQVPVPVGGYVEGPYYAAYARGNDPLLVEVPEAEVPDNARVEAVDAGPKPGEKILLVWSQNRYMERQAGVRQNDPTAPAAALANGVGVPSVSTAAPVPVPSLPPNTGTESGAPPAPNGAEGQGEAEKTEGNQTEIKPGEGAGEKAGEIDEEKGEGGDDTGNGSGTAPKWSKTKLRNLSIGDVRGIAAQVAKEHGMSLPEGTPSKENLIDFIVSATAE